MDLDGKVNRAKKILIDSLTKFGNKKVVIAWTGHKDSTVVLHMIKDVYENVPIRAFFNDTGSEFGQAKLFRKRLAKLWKIEILEIKDKDKIKAIEKAVSKYKLKAIISAIRKDENPERANETYVSKRKTHTRVHPILDFTEKDIWDYINRHKVPYLSLYDLGFRSLGELENTKKSDKSERAGRLSSKETQMRRLRALGYW